MKSRSYLCLRCEKGVKSTNGLIRHVNTCRISITLPSRQLLNGKLVLNYNTTNPLNLSSKNNKKDISPRVSNNGKKAINPTDIKNDKEDIKTADINNKMSATSNWMPQNRLLSESSVSFKEVMFNECKFLSGTPVLDIRYEHFRNQINNLFYLFNSQLDYALAHYFANSKTIKQNIDKFLTNLLMKPIIKNLSYYNVDK